MNRFNETQDDLNGKWQMLLEQKLAGDSANSHPNKIVLNDDTTQKMEVVSGQVAPNGNDLVSLRIDVTYCRTRRGKKDGWGLWEKQ